MSLALGVQPIPTPGHSIEPPELFRLLIPDYDNRMREWDATAGSDDEMWHRFDIRLSETCETDFGLGGKRYQIAAIEGQTGACSQCYLLVVGVLDPESREVLWRFGGESIGGPANVSLRRVYPRASPLTLTFQHWEGSTNWGSIRTETWVQPTLEGEGHLSFREIWSHVIEASNAGNHGGGMEHTSGWMESGVKERELLFRQSAFYADTAEIKRVEWWVVEGAGLKRVSFKSQRIDHGESEVFPFDLPIRRSFFRLESRTVPVSVYPNKARFLQSPDHEYSLEFRKDCGPEVSLFHGSRHLRTIRMRQGDSFDGHADFLGWSSDSRQFFIVASFGITNERALLSFSVGSQGDYWEKLLVDEPADWKDGFILKPAVPVR